MLWRAGLRTSTAGRLYERITICYGRSRTRSPVGVCCYPEARRRGRRRRQPGAGHRFSRRRPRLVAAPHSQCPGGGGPIRRGRRQRRGRPGQKSSCSGASRGTCGPRRCAGTRSQTGRPCRRRRRGRRSCRGRAGTVSPPRGSVRRRRCSRGIRRGRWGGTSRCLACRPDGEHGRSPGPRGAWWGDRRVPG